MICIKAQTLKAIILTASIALAWMIESGVIA
jgi:hypothetical protein